MLMMKLLKVLLSRRLALLVGSASLLAFVVAVALPALEPLSYAMSYAEGHVRMGYWTDHQASEFVRNQADGWLRQIVMELGQEGGTLFGIVGSTAILIGLQNRVRRHYPTLAAEEPPLTPWRGTPNHKESANLPVTSEVI